MKSKIHQALKSMSSQELQALDELTEKLRQKYGAQLKELKVFGSKVRGDFTSDSDIDIFLLLDRNVDRTQEDELYHIVFEIDLKFDVYISMRIFSTSKLSEPRIKNLPFIKNIEKEGITIL